VLYARARLNDYTRSFLTKGNVAGLEASGNLDIL
jgi:hypothetical protein